MGHMNSHVLVLILLFLTTTLSTKGAVAAVEPHAVVAYLPSSPREYRCRPNVDGDNRRSLAPFQLCADCQCCAAGEPTNCSNMPCCFGIDCNLPNKPYGVCAFVPKACNCTSCA